MDNSLLTEINTDLNLKEAFVAYMGMPFEDIPQELIDEAFGPGVIGMQAPANLGRVTGIERGADARQGEREWIQGMAKEQRARKDAEYRDSGQRNQMSDAPSQVPVKGDFVVVKGRPMRVMDVKQMFGGEDFVYLQGMKSPIIASRLTSDKKVGKINVFKAD